VVVLSRDFASPTLPQIFMLFDRNLAVQSQKEVRSDLALRYAKQELAGESGLGSVALPSPEDPSAARRATEQSSMSELLDLQSRGFSPIIVVPPVSSSKSRITATNVFKFLVDGVYEEPSSVSRPVMPLEITRTVSGHPIKFRVFDSVASFKKDDWKSVVAVFSDGKMWQFSGWPFRTESDLFQSIQVFSVRFSDDPVAAIASGRIRSLVLKRGTRHQDAAVMIEFWQALEPFLLGPRVRKFSSTAKLP
jgi:hypothetical protein